MNSPLLILAGALLTIATAAALGALLLRALHIQLYRYEQHLLGFIVGSAVLSGIVFVLCMFGLAYTPVFVTIGGVAIARALGFRGGLKGPLQPGLAAPHWKWMLGGIFIIFATFYFFHAMAPETSPDGGAYHLPFVDAYYRAHGFVRIPTNLYANISQGAELLFLFGYAIGRHSAAALVHFSFWLALPWLMFWYARRFAIPAAGAAAGIFVLASPIVGIDGVSAYVDVALAAVLFALFYFLQIWIESQDNRLLVPVGILAGFSFAIKYTGIVALPYSTGLMIFTLWRARRPVLKPVLTVVGLALLFMLPWLIKNWMWIGNPVTPFANRLFPNPYVHVSFEEDYRKGMRNFGITSYWRQLPYELTMGGQALCGLLGPLFLLAPVSLLAVRSRQGRQLLLAAGVFGASYFSNIGTRFLIPALPFVSLAMGVALMRFPFLLAALAIAHAIASWPSMIERYAGPYPWCVANRVPVKAAFRIEPEDSYLKRKLPAFALDRLIEQNVPAGAKVFSAYQVGQAYTTREIAVKFLAAPNEVLNDSLLMPLYQYMQPVRSVQFPFPERTAQRIRLVQTSQRGPMWSISELRFYDTGKELPRANDWRLSAQPNPWDVQLAFDNDAVTRWRSWQPAYPGMHVEVDFGGLQKIDAVVVETSFDSRDLKMQVEAEDAEGKWITVSSAPVETDEDMTISLRLAATRNLKLHGYSYLLVGDADLGAEDFRRHPEAWGIRPIVSKASSVLYAIE